MRFTASLLFVVMCAGFAASAQAQSTIIASSRRIDWSQAGVSGGIPNRTTECATLSAGASAGQINNAIQNCGNNQVVKLNAGTYNLSGAIIFNNKSNVTLRGAGPDQTFLIFNGGDGCMGLWANLCIKNGGKSSDNPGTVANWTGGYAKGSTSITLSTTSGLSVGDMLVLDQLDDSSDSGDVWICQSLACATEGGAGGRPGRAQMQFVKVTGVSGSTVSFAPGIYMPNWRADRQPQAWWVTPVVGVGIEDLSMDHANSGTNVSTGLFIGNAFDSWVKNVRSMRANRNHVWLFEAARVTIRDSYFYGTLNGASQSYGVESRMSADNLIENNIFQRVTAPMMTGNATGTVYGYNYSTDNFYYVASWMQASAYFHDAGVDNVLWEGNDGNGFNADNIHGTSNFGTMFRNRWNGWEPGKDLQTSPIIIQSSNRFMNIVGNVLGEPGFHTVYESNAPSGSNPNKSIFTLGWSSNGYTGSLANDPKVASTMLRWGNYDVVSGTRFNASEAPAGLPVYASAAPSSTTLPASMYKSARPTWFGSVAWPAIGPDVTGGDLPGLQGHAYKIPARLCFERTASSNGILNFNGTTCYGNAPAAPQGTVPAPAAPTGVKIIR
jgi:hypothetical protein